MVYVGTAALVCPVEHSSTNRFINQNEILSDLKKSDSRGRLSLRVHQIGRTKASALSELLWSLLRGQLLRVSFRFQSRRTREHCSEVASLAALPCSLVIG